VPTPRKATPGAAFEFLRLRQTPFRCFPGASNKGHKRGLFCWIPLCGALLDVGVWRGVVSNQLTAELTEAARSDPLAKRLLAVPGIGPIVASALVATIGNAANFTHARDIAAWIGLVPRQYTTGGRPRLLGLRYTGQVYLRCLIVHGARSVVRVRAHYRDPLGSWVDQLVRRTHINIAICAVANKIVRIAWAMLRKGTVYGLPATTTL